MTLQIFSKSFFVCIYYIQVKHNNHHKHMNIFLQFPLIMRKEGGKIGKIQMKVGKLILHK